MSQNIQGNDASVVPVQANGTVPSKAGSAFGEGYTLLANQTYYAKLGAKEAFEFLAQLIGNAAIIITSAYIEFCVFPEGGDALGIGNLDATVGVWVKQDAQPPVKTTPVGTGWSVTGQTLAVAGTGRGGATFEVGNTGTRRARLTINVGATGGDVRIGTFGKG